MEASIKQTPSSAETFFERSYDSTDENYEEQRLRLEELYEQWKGKIFTGVPPESLSESVAVLDINTDSLDHILTELSGYLALVVLESENPDPLKTYNAAQRAVVEKALEVHEKDLYPGELIALFVDTAVEAAHADHLATTPERTRSLVRLRLALATQTAPFTVTQQVVEREKIDELTPDQAQRTVEELEQLPALSDTRGVDAFYVNQKVLLLVGSQLQAAQVKKVEAYDNAPFTLGSPAPLTEEQISEREALLKKRQEEIRLYERQSFSPDHETLRLRMSMCPEFQTADVKNPSPGFVRLQILEGGSEVITDIHHNYIITGAAWQAIRKNPDYREQWLSSGSKESLRQRPLLEKAIEENIRAITNLK